MCVIGLHGRLECSVASSVYDVGEEFGGSVNVVNVEIGVCPLSRSCPS